LRGRRDYRAFLYDTSPLSRPRARESRGVTISLMNRPKLISATMWSERSECRISSTILLSRTPPRSS